jgi:hypothetical protein
MRPPSRWPRSSGTLRLSAHCDDGCHRTCRCARRTRRASADCGAAHSRRLRPHHADASSAWLHGRPGVRLRWNSRRSKLDGRDDDEGPAEGGWSSSRRAVTASLEGCQRRRCEPAVADPHVITERSPLRVGSLDQPVRPGANGFPGASFVSVCQPEKRRPGGFLVRFAGENSRQCASGDRAIDVPCQPGRAEDVVAGGRRRGEDTAANHCVTDGPKVLAAARRCCMVGCIAVDPAVKRSTCSAM